MRYTYSDKKTTQLCKPDSSAMIFLDEIDGQIYYVEGNEIGVFDGVTGEKTSIYKSTDGLNIGDISNDGEYFYFMKYKGNFDSGDLYKMKIGSDKAEFLGESGVEYIYLTDEYIYFRYYAAPRKDKDDYDVYFGSPQIWRMKKDGTGKEVAFEFKEDFADVNFMKFMVFGNYIYGFYQYFNEDQSCGQSNNKNEADGYSARIMRADITNGEVCFLDIID